MMILLLLTTSGWVKIIDALPGGPLVTIQVDQRMVQDKVSVAGW